MMNFLQAAEAATPQQPGMGSFWIMMLLMVGVMYFFMWRPESKRRKEMAKDEARHGAGFQGLYKRYFGK